MSKKVFSNAVLTKIHGSAVRYAREAAKSKPSIVDVMDRLSAITGVKCSIEHTTCLCRLDKLLSQLELHLLGEQKKARENTTHYDFFRHTELHSLRNYLKEKHSKLQTCCAVNKF